MRKCKWNAYYSVESSYIFSFILFFFYLVIIVSILLVDRCLISQNDYIVCLRGAMFTDGRKDYGEIRYGSEDSFDEINYMNERLRMAKSQYICYTKLLQQVINYEDIIEIQTELMSKVSKETINTMCARINPVKKIRENRY